MAMKSNKHMYAVKIFAGGLLLFAVFGLHPGQVSADQVATAIVSPATDTTAVASANTIEAPAASAGPDPAVAASLSSHSSSPQADQNNASNAVTAQSQSGDAAVLNNAVAGDATSGNALASATTIITAGTSTTGLATFDITHPGDMNGTIVIDPNEATNIAAPGTSSAHSVASAGQSAEIGTSVDLTATSGNATVSNNTGVAGNATSGNADAAANVVDVVSSTIDAPKSFVGTITICGDLTGDILMPAHFLDGVVSTSSAGDSTASSDTSSSAKSSIANDVSVAAHSGNATVSNNTGVAGNATSGNAATKTLLYVLANQQLSGGDLLLVLVNVFGAWNGSLMNASAGTSIALLGTSDAASEACSTANATSIEATNHISVAAHSGNATVSNNTGVAGNATSGNADAAANVVDLLNARITAKQWFGILFINIFGNWTGNFGVLPDQVATTPAAPAAPAVPTPTKITVAVHHHAAAISIRKTAFVRPIQLATPTSVVLGDATQAVPSSAHIAAKGHVQPTRHGSYVGAALLLGALATANILVVLRKTHD